MADNSTLSNGTSDQVNSAVITAIQNIVTAINGLTQVVTGATPSWPPQLP